MNATFNAASQYPRSEKAAVAVVVFLYYCVIVRFIICMRETSALKFSTTLSLKRSSMSGSRGRLQRSANPKTQSLQDGVSSTVGPPVGRKQCQRELGWLRQAHLHICATCILQKSLFQMVYWCHLTYGPMLQHLGLTALFISQLVTSGLILFVPRLNCLNLLYDFRRFSFLIIIQFVSFHPDVCRPEPPEEAPHSVNAVVCFLLMKCFLFWHRCCCSSPKTVQSVPGPKSDGILILSGTVGINRGKLSSWAYKSITSACKHIHFLTL